MVISVHQPQYLPWLGYFDKIARSDAFVILDDVQYKAREFQNRNRIRSADGELWLTVPVRSKGLGHMKISDVAIDNGFDWPRQHLLSIKSAYGRADHFGRHAPFLERLYSSPREKLIDLNMETVRYFMSELKIETPVYFASALGISGKKTDRIIEICGKLNSDTYLSGAGGSGYLEEGKFAASGIKLVYQEFRHPVYVQQFMKGPDDFMPCLSALDLLMSAGPDSAKLLSAGR